jgi:hypothetical protein
MKKTSKNTASGSASGLRWVPSFRNAFKPIEKSSLKGRMLAVLDGAGMDAMLLALVRPALITMPEEYIKGKFLWAIDVLSKLDAMSGEDLKDSIRAFRSELLVMVGEDEAPME